jgi:hypothetical protein
MNTINAAAVAALNFPIENDDGVVSVSFPIHTVVTTDLSPDFMSAVVTGAKDAIEAGDVPGATVLKTYRGTATGERSSIEVSYEFDSPTADGVFGQIVKLGRARLAGAMQAIATGSAAAPSGLAQAVIGAIQTGAADLDSDDYAVITQVALFGGVRSTTDAAADVGFSD